MVKLWKKNANIFNVTFDGEGSLKKRNKSALSSSKSSYPLSNTVYMSGGGGGGGGGGGSR